MFNLEYWSQFVWPVVFLVVGFLVRRYVVGEGKYISFPLTVLLALSSLGGLAFSTEPLPYYQKDCLECIEHHELVRVNTLFLTQFSFLLTIGSFVGWVTLKWKHRKEFFNFSLKA